MKRFAFATIALLGLTISCATTATPPPQVALATATAQIPTAPPTLTETPPPTATITASPTLTPAAPTAIPTPTETASPLKREIALTKPAVAFGYNNYKTELKLDAGTPLQPLLQGEQLQVYLGTTTKGSDGKETVEGGWVLVQTKDASPVNRKTLFVKQADLGLGSIPAKDVYDYGRNTNPLGLPTPPVPDNIKARIEQFYNANMKNVFLKETNQLNLKRDVYQAVFHDAFVNEQGNLVIQLRYDNTPQMAYEAWVKGEANGKVIDIVVHSNLPLDIVSSLAMSD